MLLHIERDSVFFTRDRSLHRGWRADYQGGVIILTRQDLDGISGPSNLFTAIFQTTAGAVIAKGEDVVKGYRVEDDCEENYQVALTSMWENVEQEVGRFRLLMRLATQ